MQAISVAEMRHLRKGTHGRYGQPQDYSARLLWVKAGVISQYLLKQLGKRAPAWLGTMD
jgi:hypothetical protein